MDTYNNLTLKVVMGFKWTLSECPNLKYLMKADDDEVDDVPWIVEIFNKSPKNNANTGIFTGLVLNTSIPLRNPKCKWYVL